MSDLVPLDATNGSDWAVTAEPGPAAEELCFPDVNAFVREYLIKVYRRRIIEGGPHRWAARWWDSDEAIARLTALWRAFEQLRLEPGAGMSTWWLQHADPAMRALLAPDGPFATSRDTNEKGGPLPYQPPPDGMF